MNESFKEAASLLSDEPSQYEIERAKVLATLALAYERRPPTRAPAGWKGMAARRGNDDEATRRD
jgi:hypothetical protein